jgi:hypothetical protein
MFYDLWCHMLHHFPFLRLTTWRMKNDFKQSEVELVNLPKGTCKVLKLLLHIYNLIDQ